MAWTRSGDFDKTISEENSSVNKRVIYNNKSNNRVIQQLEIYGFSGSPRIGIAVFLSNDKQLEAFLEKLPRFNGPPITVSNKKLRAAMETDNKEVIKEVLLAAHKLDRLDGQSLKEIAAELKIELPRDLDEIVKLVNAGKLQDAIDFAATSTDQDTCTEAGKYFEQKNDSENAAYFYALTAKSHAQYQEHILKAYDIINKLINAANISRTAPPKEKLMSYEILKMTCIFKIAEQDTYLRVYLQGQQNYPALINKITALENEITLLRAQNNKHDEKDKNLLHHQSTPLLFKQL